MEDFGLTGPGQHAGTQGLYFSGPAEGFNQAQMDQQKLIYNMGRIAQQPAQLRKTNAEADKLEAAVAQDKMMAQLAMQVMGAPAEEPGMRTSRAQPLESLAEISMQSGLWKQSKDLINVSSQVRGREASEIASLSRAEVNALTAQRKELEAEESIIGTASDQASLDTARALYTAIHGKPPTYAPVVYSEEAMGGLANMSMIAKDRLARAATASEYSSRDANRQSQIDYREFRKRMAEREQTLREAREKRMNKSGVDKAPDSKEVSSTTALVMNQVYPGVSLDDLDPLEKTSITNGARALVSRAKVIMKDHPALTWDQAQQQALTESRAAGDWQTSGDLLMRDKTYFKGAGKTAETAAPIPAKRDALVKGRFYTNSQGQVGQWTGTGFSPVAAPGVDTGVDIEPDDDEDEEE